jgi:hypothetical protein
VVRPHVEGEDFLLGPLLGPLLGARLDLGAHSV